MLQYDIMEKNTSIQMKDAPTEIKVWNRGEKNEALEEKDAIISEMNKQLTKARGFLTTNKVVSTCAWVKAIICWSQSLVY